jgi:hypothetical protein
MYFTHNNIMKNKLLFIFDLLVLPVTIIRSILIYFGGSRYGINKFDFLDVMLHAENKYFNQQEDNISIDTINTDIRTIINSSSYLSNDELINYPSLHKNISTQDNSSVETNINNISLSDNKDTKDISENISSELPDKIVILNNDSDIEIIKNKLNNNLLDNKEIIQSSTDQPSINQINEIIKDGVKEIDEVFTEVFSNKNKDSTDSIDVDESVDSLTQTDTERTEDLEKTLLSVERIMEEELKHIRNRRY